MSQSSLLSRRDIRISLLAASLLSAASIGCHEAEPSPTPSAVEAGATDASAASPWTVQKLAASSSLAAVWGSGAADVYAVGYAPGVIVHTTDRGASWSVRTLDAATELTAVGGSGPEDVYAAGIRAYHQPVALHSTDRGATWTQSDLQFPGRANGVWSSGPDDAYIVGSSTSGAVIAHSVDRGVSWAVSPVVQSAGLHGIWGSGPDDIFVVGSLRQDLDAGDFDGGPVAAEAGIEDGGSSAAQGVILHSVDRGLSWTTLAVTPSGGLFAVGGTADGARIDAVGDGYTLTESLDHGATWTQYSGDPRFTRTHQLTSVWLPSPDEAPFIASGADGVLRSLQSDEGSVLYDAEATGLHFVLGVTGVGDDVYAVGDGVARRARSDASAPTTMRFEQRPAR